MNDYLISREERFETLLPLINKLIGDRKLYEVEKASGIAKGGLTKLCKKERFPGVEMLKKLSSPEANPQNGVTFEALMTAAGYMPATEEYQIEMGFKCRFEMNQASLENQEERLLAYQKGLRKIAVDDTVRKIAERIRENAQEELSEETLSLMAYREYSYACCKGVSLSEEDIEAIAEEALERRNG